jgi:hypothetical protein
VIGWRTRRTAGLRSGDGEAPPTVLPPLQGLPEEPIEDGLPGAAWATSSVEPGPAPAVPVSAALAVPRVDLIGMQLRVTGLVDLGPFGRLSDYVNLLPGFFAIRDATVLTRTGQATRVTFPEVRVRLDDVMLVAQRQAQAPPSSAERRVEKQPRRLTFMTAAHLVSGTAYLHAQASMAAFIDATDPAFVPLTDVRVRWLADRRLAGRYAFALVQRAHIVGVAVGGR